MSVVSLEKKLKNPNLNNVITSSERNNTEILTLSVEANLNFWLVYGTWRTALGTKILLPYQLKESINNIQYLGTFRKLRELNMELLGISKLPRDLILLKNLEKLNISFNPLLQPCEIINVIAKLEGLKELRIKGIGFNEWDVQLLKTENPHLKVIFFVEDERDSQ